METQDCSHPRKRIVVDYDHPFGRVPDCPIATLQSYSPAVTRPFITLRNPTCLECGNKLSRAELEPRLQQGHDLYDGRFVFIW